LNVHDTPRFSKIDDLAIKQSASTIGGTVEACALLVGIAHANYNIVKMDLRLLFLFPLPSLPLLFLPVAARVS
jgi:hypothetical protein